MHCVSCHNTVAPGAHYCDYCGASLRPGPWRPTARLLSVVGLVGILALAASQVYRGLDEEPETVAAVPAGTEVSTTLPLTAAPPTEVQVTPPPATPPPATPPPATPPPSVAPLAVVKAAQILAGRPTPAAKNACGQVDSFEATHLQDGDFATAWRVRGAGVGQQIRLRLAAPTHVTQVGLVPGWAKVDGCDGADLFRQLHLVTKVRWVFDGGKVAEQDLDPSPDLQLIPVDVVSRNVTLQILATSAANGIDMTAVSEVQVSAIG